MVFSIQLRLLLRAFCALAVLCLLSCTNPLGPSKIDGELAKSVIFPGWTHVKAMGPVAPSTPGNDLSTANAYVTLEWSAMSANTGESAGGYKIYRATDSSSFDLQSPIGTSTTTSFTDTSVTSGNTYYYRVAPVITGVLLQPGTSSDRAIKIMVPPANMFLVHRWIANRQMCGLMGKSVDRENNYRCAVATGTNAPPATSGSGYFDFGHSIFVDTYEQGCNYTATNSCADATVNGGAAGPCIGIRTTPQANVTAAAGTVYYSRRSFTCYVNTSAGSGTTWTAAHSTSSALRATMGSGAPGLPPFGIVSQADSAQVCAGQSVAGVPSPAVKRLLRRTEQLIAGSWPSTTSDTAIDSLESGASLDTNHYCNTARALPQGNNSTDISGTNPLLAFDDATFPAVVSGGVNNRDTLPSCLHSDCSASAAGLLRQLRTGSNATTSCVSRYGGRDFVGNVWEYTSDQTSCNGTTCSGVTAAANSVDTTNDDGNGVVFDGTVQGPTSSSTFDVTGRLQYPIGMPIMSSSFSGDGVVIQNAASFHGSAYFAGATAGTKAFVTGGSAANGSGCGVYTISYLGVVSAAANADNGFRCAVNSD